ncbi:hypothetical protein [Sporolactobacillus putidus]|uniref:Uncharacterized protein n=1 Tax=Sporolactobacillus putidus TaxID=492735 RepID=A0A917VY43_9BACL|nr:hypothetical protein [Sporolactobacillus putidus]GGL43258.1 hypothetical protein GCM10007968_03950 [Sporolactobacillus putidus]
MKDYLVFYCTWADTAQPDNRLWDTVTTSPVEVLGNVVNASIHPVRTYDIIKTAIVQSYERDMVHGNAYTRSRWITYALAMVATSVVGTKGVDKVGKAADLAELSSQANPIKPPARWLPVI